MKICHVITMSNIEKMGAITRHIYNDCIGEHYFCNINGTISPNADIYILHCFKNQKYFHKFIKFKKPNDSCKVVSLIHSSEPCMPSKCSDEIVTITNTWKKRLDDLYGIKSTMIHGGIDIDKFDVTIDYSKKVFGKITRPEAGKYHSEWNNLVKNIFDNDKDVKCRIISNNYKKLDYLKHERMEWIEGIEINDYENKVKELSKLSVYTECHDDGENAFIDTFCISALEAMACGLPIIILRGLQEPLCEVVGDYAIICETIAEYRKKLIMLLDDLELKEEYGLRAKVRAKRFTKDRMIHRWNNLIMYLSR